MAVVMLEEPGNRSTRKRPAGKPGCFLLGHDVKNVSAVHDTQIRRKANLNYVGFTPNANPWATAP